MNRPRRIALRISDIMIIKGIGRSQASREMHYTRAVLNKKRIHPPPGMGLKPRWQIVTIREYCQLNDIDETNTRTTINAI